MRIGMGMIGMLPRGGMHGSGRRSLRIHGRSCLVLGRAVNVYLSYQNYDNNLNYSMSLYSKTLNWYPEPVITANPDTCLHCNHH